MKKSSIRIRLIDGYRGGSSSSLSLPGGTTIRSFLSEYKFPPTRRSYTRVNGHPASMQQELKEGDRVSVTPRQISGAVQTPLLTQFLAYLKSHGFSPKPESKGDRQSWEDAEGHSVIVTRSDEDGRRIHWKALKKLAQLERRAMSRTLAEVIDDT